MSSAEPDSNKYFAYSVCFHLLVGAALIGLLPDKQPILPPQPQPPKVTFVELQKPPEEKPGTVLDAPAPKVLEEPNTLEYLSNANSRMHSGTSETKAEEYRNHKTAAPKNAGLPNGITEGALLPAVKKPEPKPKPPKPAATRAEKAPVLADRGIAHTEADKPAPAAPSPETAPRRGASTLAMLNGFDPSKYASLDTRATGDADDDQPVSLDTKETKYISYFTRIKQQIERVWIYPAEAAQHGLSGELTLRFQIARDGSLMGVSMVQGSGSEVLDFAAVDAVKNATPYYPIPVTINKDKLTILATFIYSPSYKTP